MRWYFLNTMQRVRFAMRNPRYVLRALAREVTLADERFLAAATGTRPNQIREFLQEPFESPEFLAHLHQCEPAFRQGMGSADLWGKKVLVQYAAVRALRPDLVVETGVASGVSSAYILLALERNQKGTLHSVEVGDPAYLPPGKETGWVVPHRLRARWRLHIGDVRTILLPLLRELGEVGIFIHDSLHSYDHMKWEFELAHPHIKRGGLLLADDALWNPAFPEFARAISSPRSAIIRGVGVLAK
ncbi:MAG TPA: class I SAM-dependent methyltransferase [Terriglobia bacterium]|nr:class I SAM-dependent methyltransferase [Terriglobia bacterium]